MEGEKEGGREKGRREGHEEALSGRKIEEKEAYSRKAIFNVQLMGVWGTYDEYMMKYDDRCMMNI